MVDALRYWKLCEKDGVAYLGFAGWPGVRVFYSTRVGGVSRPPFDSLNLHYGRGDTKAHVHENRRRFFSAVAIDEGQVVYTRQKHSTIVHRVRHCGEVLEGDGMITNRRGLYLGIFTADCLGIFLFSSHPRAIGALHAGRKGLQGSILKKGIRLFSRSYGIEPGSIEALCGPSIGPCCYKIGEELQQAFAGTYIIRRGADSFLDLWSIAADQLKSAGISRIYMPRLCSATRSDLFFSYRQSGENVGENLGVIGIEEEHVTA